MNEQPLMQKRQHPLWMLYQIGVSVKEVIVPILIFFVFNIRNEALWVKLGSIALILYIIFRIITIIFQWKNHTYLFTDNNVEVKEGRFVSNKRYIALNRIQSHQQQTSVLHRLFGLTSLSLITGTSSDNAVIKFEMISDKEAERIKWIIQENKLNTPEDDNELNEKVAKDQQKLHYKISFGEIFLIALTSIYVIAIFPVLVSIYFKIDEIFKLDAFVLQIFSFLTDSWILITITLLFLIGFGIGSGVIITYLRFGNYQVSSDHEQIYISRGIFNKTFYTIPREKVNGLIIEKAIPRRLFKFVKVKIVSLGDLFDESEMETDILFPFIRERKLKDLLPEILPSFKLSEEMNPLPKQALFVNLIQPSYLLVIVTFFIFFFWPEFWFVPVIYAFLLIFYRIAKTYLSKYAQTGKRIQFQTGVLVTETFITIREKVDELEVNQSWLEQQFGLATISLTSRAKPIHVSTLEHLPIETVIEYYLWFKQEASGNNRVNDSKQADI
ncbi:PH domain-containing protein [Pseudogracilibacillus sp. SE30717A]|uniref:PH domain-containing protein n=1 Tax=Pseudogracilibacillus sp. SE30717A TaxID=3098293 RepID=UPI00300E079C